MRPEVTILPARATDAGAIADLLVAQMLEHRVRSNRATLKRLVRQFLHNQRRGFALVARLENEVIGVAYVPIIISMEHGGPLGWLEELYVTPSRRGRGVGTLLVKAVIRHARRLHLTALDLEVDVEHKRAEKLYARHGFRRLARSRWVKVIHR